MRHLSTAVRPVYRHPLGGRSFTSKAQAYYDLAKRMILAKYPPELVAFEGDFDASDVDGFFERIGARIPPTPAEHFGLSVDVCKLRQRKARALYWIEVGDGYNEQCGEIFDQDRWRRFVRRVARRLRWSDKKGGAT